MIHSPHRQPHVRLQIAQSPNLMLQQRFFSFFHFHPSSCDLFNGEQKKLHIIKVHLRREFREQIASVQELQSLRKNRFNFFHSRQGCCFTCSTMTWRALMPFPVYWELLPFKLCILEQLRELAMTTTMVAWQTKGNNNYSSRSDADNWKFWTGFLLLAPTRRG